MSLLIAISKINILIKRISCKDNYTLFSRSASALVVLQGQCEIKQNFHQLQIPLLIFQGNEDLAVDPQANLDLFLKTKSKLKEFIHIPSKTY
jgi:hypothetical protein